MHRPSSALWVSSSFFSYVNTSTSCYSCSSTTISPGLHVVCTLHPQHDRFDLRRCHMTWYLGFGGPSTTARSTRLCPCRSSSSHSGCIARTTKNSSYHLSLERHRLGSRHIRKAHEGLPPHNASSPSSFVSFRWQRVLATGAVSPDRDYPRREERFQVREEEQRLPRCRSVERR